MPLEFAAYRHTTPGDHDAFILSEHEDGTFTACVSFLQDNGCLLSMEILEPELRQLAEVLARRFGLVKRAKNYEGWNSTPAPPVPTKPRRTKRRALQVRQSPQPRGFSRE